MQSTEVVMLATCNLHISQSTAAIAMNLSIGGVQIPSLFNLGKLIFYLNIFNFLNAGTYVTLMHAPLLSPPTTSLNTAYVA
jgi:hypothetical protein